MEGSPSPLPKSARSIRASAGRLPAFPQFAEEEAARRDAALEEERRRARAARRSRTVADPNRLGLPAQSADDPEILIPRVGLACGRLRPQGLFGLSVREWR
jgi:hypothetical protein